MSTKIILAPMEGVVDFHLRQVYSAIADIDMCVTEFIRVNEHVMPRKVFTRTCPELQPEHTRFSLLDQTFNAHPVKVQLLGSDPELLAANARKVAKLGAVGVDLNFGCPAKTVNRNKGGAILLDDTALIYDIVSAVRESVPETTPVSAKIRLGFDNRDSYMENALAIAKAGANQLAVHARSKADGYNPPAYWHCIGEIQNEVAIQVVANGEIWTLEDYIKCKEQSGCSHFMLGRGLLANPGLAREIKRHEAGLSPQKTQWAEILPYLCHFFEQTSQVYPKKYMGNRLKQWLHYLRGNFNEARQLFEQIKREKSYERISNLLLNSSP